MRDSGSCHVFNNLYKQVAVSGLFTKVIPMFRSQSEQLQRGPDRWCTSPRILVQSAEWLGFAGAFLAAAKALSRSLDKASVATLRTRDCLCSAADLVEPLEMGATSHSARTMDHRAGQSSDEEVKSGFQEMSAVAFRRVDSRTSQGGADR